jgi:transposase
VRVDKVPVVQATAAFGFCRQSFYAIAAALDAGGPAALVPGKPGPRGPRKLTEEVMAFVEQLRSGDAALRSDQLARAVEREFGVTVHPRSVEKALARRREPRSAEVPDHR